MFKCPLVVCPSCKTVIPASDTRLRSDAATQSKTSRLVNQGVSSPSRPATPTAPGQPESSSQHLLCERCAHAPKLEDLTPVDLSTAELTARKLEVVSSLRRDALVAQSENSSGPTDSVEADDEEYLAWLDETFSHQQRPSQPPGWIDEALQFLGRSFFCGGLVRTVMLRQLVRDDAGSPLLGGYGTFVKKSKNGGGSGKEGLRPPPNPEPSQDACYIVQKGDTLERIACKTQTDPEKIIRLNPHVFPSGHEVIKVYPGQAITIDDAYDLHLPPTPDSIEHGWGQVGCLNLNDEILDYFVAQHRDLSWIIVPSAKSSSIPHMHIVRRSDSLESIASEYNTSVKRLRQDNREHFPVGERGNLVPGMKLLIRYINTVDSETLAKLEALYLDIPPPPPQGFLYHEVQEGEKWDEILDAYHMNYASLLQFNRIFFPEGVRVRLTPGQRLLVFDPALPRIPEKVNCAEVVLRRMIHEVRCGESPELIAEMYGMSMDELREENRCYFPKGYSGHIRPGMKLVVKRVPGLVADAM